MKDSKKAKQSETEEQITAEIEHQLEVLETFLCVAFSSTSVIAKLQQFFLLHVVCLLLAVDCR